MESTIYKQRRIRPLQYGKVPSWVCFAGYIPHLSRRELAILYVLAVRADNDQQCNTTLQILARESGVGLKSISRTTKELEGLEIIGKRRHGNRIFYSICPAPSWMVEREVYWSPGQPRRHHAVHQIKNHGRYVRRSLGSHDSEEYGITPSEHLGNGLKSNNRF